MSKEMTNAELDALIATKVMGWVRGNISTKQEYDPFYDAWHPADWSSYFMCSAWHPTEDISQAMQAVEKIEEENNCILLLKVTPNESHAMFEGLDGSPLTDWMHDKETPTAICKAIASAIQ